MTNSPFSPWPSFSNEEILRVAAVLRSGRINYWTGEEGRQFESEFAAWCGVKHAVALANGTVAIDLALKILGVGPGDEVIVTPRTFIASASSVVNAGARPVFVDVDPDSQNITATTIRPACSSRTKAIICVHLAGWPCEMDGIVALARELGLHIIEDCAQAHGGIYRGKRVGSFGDVAAWSFCQDKIMTTGGEGGMLITNSSELWRRAWSYKDHGKSWDAVFERQDSAGFRWLHESFGTNWRMTEMQAAIGRIQLRMMPQWHSARRRNGEAIMRAARSSAIFRVPAIPDYVEHGWYKAYVFVDRSRLGVEWNRERVMAEINARGVPCGTGSCPEIYLEKAFDDAGLRPHARLPVARELGETSLMFLVHPTLTEAEIEKTCRAITEIGVMAAGRGVLTSLAHAAS